MRIEVGLPPNILEISKKFNFRGFNPVFAYGEILYNPLGLPITEDLMVHERVHEKQQLAIGVEQWWAMYISDVKFRLLQEVEAYQAQYRYIKEHYNRKTRLTALNVLAETLAGPMYGNIINKKEAKELIDG